jgi:glycerate 2-kinase
MHILIAPNAFKNCLSATAVAEAILQGLKKSTLQFTAECFPVGDGGDGTGELIIKQLNGATIFTEVHDPLGKKIKSSYGFIMESKTAIIEMADASGLRLLSKKELNPLKASSYGTGELIKQALDRGAKKIIIGIGGSATVDGGCGILKALGVRFLDSERKELPVLPEDLLNLNAIDFTGLDARIADCEIIVLCDVDTMLLGKNGAALVFGPQKGATQNDLEVLEKTLERFANIIIQQTGKDLVSLKSGGAAGGVAAGLYAVLNAKLVNGIDYFLNLTEFDKAIQRTNMVITGEGSIDEQTLNGKGPFGVAYRAKCKDIPVIGLAGKVPIEISNNLKKYFDVLLSIGNQPSDLDSALACTSENLKRTAKEIGSLLTLRINNQRAPAKLNI